MMVVWGVQIAATQIYDKVKSDAHSKGMIGPILPNSHA